MSAFIDDDRTDIRRWSFSAAFVVALHVAIATAALTWRMTVEPANSVGQAAVVPFFVDLTPLPAAPRPTQGEPQPEGINKQAEAPPAATAPIAPAPPQSAEGVNNSDARTVSGGGAGASYAAPGNAHGSGATLANPMVTPRVDPGPLDTSITVLPVLHPTKAGGLFERNKMILLRPSRRPGEPEHPYGLSATRGAGTNVPDARTPGTHGPGAHVQDRVRAAIARGMHPAAGGRNAVGGATAPGAVGNGRNAIGAATTTTGIHGDGRSSTDGVVVRNAIGMPVPIHQGTPEITNAERKAGPIASTGAAPNIGAINGHDMSRPDQRPGALGGPAKATWGVLRGSDFKPRR